MERQLRNGQAIEDRFASQVENRKLPHLSQCGSWLEAVRGLTEECEEEGGQGKDKPPQCDIGISQAETLAANDSKSLVQNFGMVCGGWPVALT